MHIEVQVALNFVISYLYNKLPRRRVNIFGEELEKALKDKFKGHWYPEKPFKVRRFRNIFREAHLRTVKYAHCTIIMLILSFVLSFITQKSLSLRDLFPI